MVLGELTHGSLGRVVVTMRRNSSRASARWRGGVVHLNVPAGIRGSRIAPILDELAPRLLASRPELSYADGQVLSFPGFSVGIRRQRLAPGKVLGKAALPVSAVGVGAELDFGLGTTTLAISDMLLKIARKVAPGVLLPVARECAERVGARPAAWAARSSSARASHFSTVRPHRAASAPARTRPRLMAAPMPPAAPVIRTVLPSREKRFCR